MTTPRLDIIANDANRCGEGPIWDPAKRRLLWTDIPADTIHEFTPATGKRRAIRPGISVSTIALTKSGDLLLGGAGGLFAYSENAGARPLLTQHEGQPLPINDMIATPAGGLYFGTIHWGAAMEKHGRLYHFDPKGGVTVVDDGIELANGLGFSPDAKTLYFADSAPRRIYAYDVNPNNGALSRKRVFAQLTRDDGLPDGLTVDADGFVWCACWYGGQVIRFDPAGKVERRIVLPVLQVSSCAFGGDALDEFFITTAAEAWPSPLAPASYDGGAANQGGALYRVRPGVGGRAEFLAGPLGDGEQV